MNFAAEVYMVKNFVVGEGVNFLLFFAFFKIN